MTADTEITLDQMHDAVVSAISAAQPGFQTVAAYPPGRGRLPLPAILVDMEDMEAAPDDDPGTGQVAMATRWRARAVLGFRSAEVEREVRTAAAALVTTIHLNRWGLPVEPARVTVAAPDAFTPELDEYVVWAVEWEQIVHLGESVWLNDGTVPVTVLASWAPGIGPEHEGDYEPVEGSVP